MCNKRKQNGILFLIPHEERLQSTQPFKARCLSASKSVLEGDVLARTNTDKAHEGLLCLVLLIRNVKLKQIRIILHPRHIVTSEVDE